LLTITCIVVFFLLLTGCGDKSVNNPGSDSIPVVANRYTGFITSPVSGGSVELAVAVSFQQNGEALTGTWSMDSGTSGTLTGTISDDQRCALTFEQSIPCEGSFECAAELTSDGRMISGTFTGFDCMGGLDGNMTLRIPAPDKLVIAPVNTDVQTETPVTLRISVQDSSGAPIALFDTVSINDASGTVSPQSVYINGDSWQGSVTFMKHTRNNRIEVRYQEIAGESNLFNVLSPDSTLHHYTIEIPPEVHAGAHFPVNITAISNTDNILLSSDTLTLSDSTDTVQPAQIILQNGVWSGDVTISSIWIGNTLTCTNGKVSTVSEEFNVIREPDINLDEPVSILETFYSPLVDTWYRIYVGLPDDYSPTGSYPVIVLMDADWYFDGSHYRIDNGGAYGITTRLRTAQQMPPAILVGVGYPPMLPNGRGRDAHYKPDRYLQFLSEELLPFIDNRLATGPGTDRILIGHSSMGNFALHALFEYNPTLPYPFGHIIALSGSYTDRTTSLLRDEKDMFDRLQPANRLPISLYLETGTNEEEQFVVGHGEMVERLTGRQYAGFRFQHALGEGLNHGTVVAPGIEKGLQWIFESLK
jgi:uncharacterized protein